MFVCNEYMIMDYGNGGGGGGYNNNNDGYDSDDDDGYDTATTHACNADLRTHEIVRGFFNDVKRLKSLEDPNTRKQLATLPVGKGDLVVPLFEDIASATEYQWHPSFTNLDPGNLADNPHPDIFYLSVDGRRLPLDDPERPQLVLGIGRLFVNTKGGDREHVSKWTGYEIFVDYELGLWLVSIEHRCPKTITAGISSIPGL
ncbi:hypothetical protein GGR51DRAFT_520666 [Nemania sp. FL0031]|nr:hypothetical protein GGR51DRAFT_520666 [Nemania sp. FL0031]